MKLKHLNFPLRRLFILAFFILYGYKLYDTLFPSHPVSCFVCASQQHNPATQCSLFKQVATMPSFNKMDFYRSSQARSWLFDELSLSMCREKSNAIHFSGLLKGPRLRKFASGFHRRFYNSGENSSESEENIDLMTKPLSSTTTISSKHQEALVRFHSNHIQALVGPRAFMPGLRGSVNVLATAITLFRRFYLSNSVLDFNPRRIAAGAALLAAKVEEEKIEIGLLAYATKIISSKIPKASPYSSEFAPISIKGIEAAERDLMSGINYELRCHHPTGTIHGLAFELSAFKYQRSMTVLENDDNETELSPRDNHSAFRAEYPVQKRTSRVTERAFSIALKAITFSDIPFFYAPGEIAMAVTVMAYGPIPEHEMQQFLRRLFPSMSRGELLHFQKQVWRVVNALMNCPLMNSDNPVLGKHNRKRSAEGVDDELCAIFMEVSNARRRIGQHVEPEKSIEPRRKKCRIEYERMAPKHWTTSENCAKVTPTKNY